MFLIINRKPIFYLRVFIMKTFISKILMSVGDNYPILQMKRVYGGSINESYYIKTKQDEYFLKFHQQAPKQFFALEKLGLALIGETKTISVPKVLSFSDQVGSSYLLLEWVDGEKRVDTEKELGQQMARLHQHTGKKHGFDRDTYIGLLPQPNQLYDHWLDYYREKRLLSQLNEGIKRNRMPRKRRTQLEKLILQLDRWIPQQVMPSYLHGDLWGGNWLVGPGGTPYVIDPSFLYGDRHFELAFTELFGGFSSVFYDAYQQILPIEDYYEEVKPLYQLYYLLVHLNIFGETYGLRVDHILDRYVGE